MNLLSTFCAVFIVVTCAKSKKRYRFVDYNAMSDQQRGEMLIERVKTRDAKNFILSDDDDRADICDWTGVACDSSGSVSAISWDFFGLTGYMDLCFMPPRTQRFKTHGNDISGKIEAVKLPRGLRVLDISGCSFHGDLRFADLPPSLEQLWIPGNSLTGTIFMSEAQKSLQIADLSDNYFTALIGDREGLRSIRGLESVFEIDDHQVLWDACRELVNRDVLVYRRNENLQWLHSVFANEEGHIENVYWASRRLEGSMIWGSLPQFLVSVHLNDNLLSGGLNLHGLPPSLLLLDLSNNKFVQEIVTIETHDGMERIDLRGNAIEKAVSPDGHTLSAPMVEL